MKKLMVIIGLWLVVSVLVACSPASYKSEEAVVGKERVSPMPPPSPEVWMDESSMSKAGAPVAVAPEALATGEQWATERMIVRTGNIALVVTDVPIAIDQITGMTDGFEGYVVSSNVWRENERLVGSITIRVTAKHFANAMKALRELAVDVSSESSSSKDVTEEYVDLSAKLSNLEATEAQLLSIMAKAETVEDILNVQRELSRTRGEIEQTKARLQYLERTSATSLITVRLEQSQLGVKFTASTARVKEGEKVQFYSEIAGGFAPYSYEWDFGDGSTSTEEMPTHTYKTDGSYTVSLTVTDDRNNTETETRTGYIVVLPGWSAGIIAGGAWNGLVAFGRGLANMFIWIGIFSPVWIGIGGIVYGIIYWRRRRRKQPQ